MNQKITIYDICTSQWPFFHLTFKCDLDRQLTWTNVSMDNCVKSFWNPCINVQVKFWTSSIYDHIFIWPSSVTLTFNLPEQMFQMALLLLKDNNSANLFWNPCINVQIMARTSSLWPFYHLTAKCHLDLQPTYTNVLNGTSTPPGKQPCQIILKFMQKCKSYGPTNLARYMQTYVVTPH